MRKQIVGIAIILFGILLTIPNKVFDIWIPVVDSIPWGGVGVIAGITGLIVVIMNTEDK